MSEISRWESTAMKLAERLRASEAQTESWIVLARLANEGRFNAEARVKELEEKLGRLADEVERGRLDCQCGDMNCQHVTATDELLEAICDCVRVPRGEEGR